MKRAWKLIAIGIAVMLLAGLALTSCSSGVSQEDYDAVVAERDTALAALDEAEDEIADLEDEIADCEADLEECLASLPEELPASLSVVDELAAMLSASDRDAQIVAFGALSTAINEIGDEDLDALLRQVVIKGGQSDEAAAEANLDMVTFILGQFADAAEAFPAEIQPKIELSDEIDALLAADDADKPAAFGALGAAVQAIGDSELDALFSNVATAGAQSAYDGTMAMIGLVAGILADAADAVK